MNKFVVKHQDNIHGVLSCFDRVLFKGHNSLSCARRMEGYIARKGLLIKDFGKLVKTLSEKVVNHAKDAARNAGRPYIYLRGKTNKEELVKEMIAEDGVKEGLVCVLSALEGCQSFKVAWGKRRPEIKNAARKCLCLYYYFLDPVLGLTHVRVQSWMPITIQVCVNGHDWLARKMDAEGIRYEKADNCFVRVDDVEAAQRLSDQFQRLDWVEILSNLASRVNPLLGSEMRNDYYWVTDQAEHAMDVMFENDASLSDLYQKLLERAILRFSAEDVLSFLGKKFTGAFKGDQINSMSKRLPGARVKHWVKNNWLKMYNKAGSVLRVETVINNPYEFKILRKGIRQGQEKYGWYPMAKRVSNLYRYAEICATANERYLDALAVEPDPRPAKEAMRKISASKRFKGRGYGGFNPAKETDIKIFAAVTRGEHLLSGFTNKDVRLKIFKPANSEKETRRQSSRVTRIFKRLHLRGFIVKVSRTRRWKVTQEGWRCMGAALKYHHRDFPEVIDADAA